MPRGRKFGHPVSEETRKKIRQSHLGVKRAPHSEETKKKMSLAQKGRPANHVITQKTRNKLKESSLKRVRNGTHPWGDGTKTTIHQKIRGSGEYGLWRKAVYERDKYTCIWCGQVGGNLHADHIKPFAHYPELRFAIDNGRTLCLDCHKKTNTWLNKSRWNK